MSAKEGKKNFEEHFKKLEQLSRELQNNEVPIDHLVARMKDALESIQVCKSVLQETKSQLTEINKAFEEIEGK